VIVRTVVLFVVWLVLTQQLDPFYLTIGAVTALGVSWLNTAGRAHGITTWLQLVAYLPWLVWQVLLSGKHVAYLVLHPRLPIDPKIIRYRVGLTQPGAIVLFGNSITLTPGTITAEVSAEELVVHTIDDDAAAGLQEMEARVARVFPGVRAPNARPEGGQSNTVASEAEPNARRPVAEPR
jgi:multicomponent Na+:H+ antiporter subunit E